MTYGLIVLTGLSVAMSAALGLLVFRMRRDERRRSDARVAALAAMTADTRAVRAQSPAVASVVAPKANSPSASRVTRPDPADLDLRPRTEVAGVADLFGAGDRPAAAPRSPRLAIIGTVALIIAVAATLALTWPRRASTAAGTEVAAQIKPLELVSLKYTTQPGSFTVTGLVQNPRDTAPLSGVAATALLFAADGTLLASGRAPLDFTTIAPGDESPFVVTVPVTGTVARYRIGFRGADGRVIAHVDRRGDGSLARNQ